MADSLLETQRAQHEEIERICVTAVKEYQKAANTVKEKVDQEHRVKRICVRVSENAKSLLEEYNSGEGSLRRREINSLGGPDPFSAFYSRLRSIREHHRQAKSIEIVTPMQMELDNEYGSRSAKELKKEREEGSAAAAAQANPVEFSGEEGYGRYLDLHAMYDRFINLKGIERVDYVDYVSSFAKLYDVECKHKNATYKKYVDDLGDYLIGFVERGQPLKDLQAEMAQVYTGFEEAWGQGKFPGWSKADLEEPAKEEVAAEALDLAGYSSAAELEALGLDRLKAALMASGLKVGGTAPQRAERLFSTKGKDRAQWDKSILAGKAKRGGKKKKAAGNSGAFKRTIALSEAKVFMLGDMLSSVADDTRENIQRKQARTGDELQDEDEDQAIEAESDDEEGAFDSDGEEIYNPKGLPLGWDGKPIPYWLYKLHGLNIKYNCEICGNFAYRGPKNFQRHFSEWRHAHGMRCLGIPNTSHFQNVTGINDARALWAKLQDQKSAEAFKATEEEEYEDSNGNVLNKKTYEDLKRQGLL